MAQERVSVIDAADPVTLVAEQPPDVLKELLQLVVETAIRAQFDDHIVYPSNRKERTPLFSSRCFPGARGVSLLARNEGQVFTRDQLIEAVWGFDFEGDPRTVDVHVRRIRRAIGDPASAPRYLHTVHGLGYKLTAPR